MTELFQSTLNVKVGNDTYEFRVPTLHDEIKLGVRIKKIRQAAEPDWTGLDQQLEPNAQYYLRAAAVFELLLERSSVTWPWSEGKAGPVVDSSKFPAANVADVLKAYRGYQDALDTFRDGGNTDTNEAST